MRWLCSSTASSPSAGSGARGRAPSMQQAVGQDRQARAGVRQTAAAVTWTMRPSVAVMAGWPAGTARRRAPPPCTRGRSRSAVPSARRRGAAHRRPEPCRAVWSPPTPHGTGMWEAGRAGSLARNGSSWLTNWFSGVRLTAALWYSPMIARMPRRSRSAARAVVASAPCRPVRDGHNHRADVQFAHGFFTGRGDWPRRLGACRQYRPDGAVPSRGSRSDSAYTAPPHRDYQCAQSTSSHEAGRRARCRATRSDSSSTA